MKATLRGYAQPHDVTPERIHEWDGTPEMVAKAIDDVMLSGVYQSIEMAFDSNQIEKMLLEAEWARLPVARYGDECGKV